MAPPRKQSPTRRRSAAPSPLTPVPHRRRPPSPHPQGNLAAQKGGGRGPRRPVEPEADAIADRIRRGERVHGAGGMAEPVIAPPGGGRPLGPAARGLTEKGLGLDARRVRVHEGPEAAAATASLGARAVADGGHIWLGAGESEQDRELMAHELAHVFQGEPGLHLREATWLERRAWLSFFDHYLPRKFLNNYMDDTGAPITLTEREMIDVNPIVSIRRSRGFLGELAAAQKDVRASAARGAPSPAVRYIEVTGPGGALTNGTLGNFTITYKGMLTVDTDGTWVFVGTMEFYDIWDFDPKPFGTSGRSTAGELKTRVGAYGIPGKPFEISSVPALCVQTGSDRRAVWAGGTPRFVNDRAGRAVSDIAVGGEVGAGAGPTGVDVGGETGAQSAEDLNP